jgi:hypothetical protein
VRLLLICVRILMAMPKKISLHRVLRRHRQVALSTKDAQQLLPPPTDLSFDFPNRFSTPLIFDSGPGDNRILILGNRTLLDGLARAVFRLPDGTFKIVPSIFSSSTLSIFSSSMINPAAVYCLLRNKSRATYCLHIAGIKILFHMHHRKIP